MVIPFPQTRKQPAPAPQKPARPPAEQWAAVMALRPGERLRVA
jgi:hypothetical protein